MGVRKPAGLTEGVGLRHVPRARAVRVHDPEPSGRGVLADGRPDERDRTAVGGPGGGGVHRSRVAGQLDRRRAEKRRRDRLEIQEDDAATEYDALDSVVADETERRMRDAVKRLSPTQREVFALRVAEGLSYKEIAEAVGTTEGAARVHYHNAMRTVKEFLDE